MGENSSSLFQHTQQCCCSLHPVVILLAFHNTQHCCLADLGILRSTLRLGMVTITGELGRGARDGGVGANPGVTPAGGSECALTVGLGGLPEPGQRDEHGP